MIIFIRKKRLTVKLKKNKFSKLINIIKNTILSEVARFHYFFIKNLKKEEIWLICETQFQAQENGYYLFKWIRTNYPNLKVYYVISKNAPNLENLLKLENILYYESYKQILYLYLAKKLISTHGLWIIPNEMGILKKYTRKTLNAKGIMLNHGIGFLKNGKQYYDKKHFALNNLIISLSSKHKNIFTEYYGYDDKDIVVTGYPRFDDMIDESDNSNLKNLITIMPTYRDKEDNLSEDEFKKTNLFFAIKKIISDNNLKSFLEKQNIFLGIYLHQNIQKYNYLFDSYSTEKILILKQGQYNVQKLLKESKLLITDYSSVLFDFVYMNKPFISYQFDYDEFINSRIDKAFLDFKSDLPGYVVNNHIDLINLIFDIVNSNYYFPSEHKNKAKEFFRYNDQANCYRVFQEIQKLR